MAKEMKTLKFPGETEPWELVDKGARERIPTVTPQMFGARGDGTADDTAAFQAALDSGKPVFAPAGEYHVTGLTLPVGGELRGAGHQQTLLVGTGAGPILTVEGAAYARVADLALDGGDRSRDGLAVTGRFVTVEGCLFTNCGRAVYFDYGDSWTGFNSIRSNVFRQNDYGVYVLNQAYEASKFNGNHINDNYFDYHEVAIALANGDSNWICNNIIEHSRVTAIFLSRCLGVEVQGNHIEQNNHEGPTTYDGLFAVREGTLDLTADMVIAGSLGYSTTFDNYTNCSRYVSIVGNHFIDNVNTADKVGVLCVGCIGLTFQRNYVDSPSYSRGVRMVVNTATYASSNRNSMDYRDEFVPFDFIPSWKEMQDFGFDSHSRVNASILTLKTGEPLVELTDMTGAVYTQAGCYGALPVYTTDGNFANYDITEYIRDQNAVIGVIYDMEAFTDSKPRMDITFTKADGTTKLYRVHQSGAADAYIRSDTWQSIATFVDQLGDYTGVKVTVTSADQKKISKLLLMPVPVTVHHQ